MFQRQLIIAVTLLFVISLSTNNSVLAQPTLPDMASVNQNGLNILTWNCQYDGVKTIAVQRSSDSNFNFITIGYVRNVKKGVQYYLDGHPKAGANWYRIKLVFGSDLSWTGNRIKVMVDSSQIAQGRVMPSNDSLQGLISKFQTKTVQTTDSSTGKTNKKPYLVTSTVKNTDTAKVSAPSKPSITLEIPDIESVNSYSYIKSQYVFTNPFTGHVNIEIADAKTDKYSIEFFDEKNIKILEVPRINDVNVILDKRNFQRVGMFKFELFKDKTKVETGYITIY